MPIVHCCYCNSAALRMTDKTCKQTIDSDIGGGETTPITGTYHVLWCQTCHQEQWLDVYGKTHFLGKVPPFVDTPINLTNRGVSNG